MKKEENLSWSGLWSVLKKTFEGFNRDNVMKMSASLAYYTIITIGPLLIVILFLAGLIFSKEEAEASLIEQVQELMGPGTANQIRQIISNAAVSGGSFVASVFGFAVLALGATTVFTDMQNSLNRIWQLRPRPDSGWSSVIFTRLMSFVLIGGIGFLLIVSLVVNALLDILLDKLREKFPDITVYVVYISNMVISFLIIAAMFGLIFKVLPDAKIRWRNVIPGALFTAFLFIIARFGIGFYLSKSDVGSTYGAASSIILLLLWVYYSSVVLYTGAEFTKAYIMKYGDAVRPNRYAVTVKITQVDSEKETVQENEEEREMEEQHEKERQKHRSSRS